MISKNSKPFPRHVPRDYKHVAIRMASIDTLVCLLNDLVAADRKGNLEGHLQVIQILLSLS